jgi:putative oxidoreductase
MSKFAQNNSPIQNALSLAGRVLFVALFLPAGIGKLTGFEGTVGYIGSVGLPGRLWNTNCGNRVDSIHLGG